MTIQTEFNFPKDSFGYVPGAVPAKMIYSMSRPENPVEGLWWVKVDTQNNIEGVYFYTKESWLFFGLGVGVVISESAPENPRQGMRWLNMSIPAIFVYYFDGDQGQWVEETNEAGNSPLNSYVGDVAPENPTQGTRWYNPKLPATFIYIIEDDSEQWVEESFESPDGALREDLKNNQEELKGTSLPFSFKSVLFAALPTASSFGGSYLAISDRGFKLVYSDGSVWRFVSNDLIVS